MISHASHFASWWSTPSLRSSFWADDSSRTRLGAPPVVDANTFSSALVVSATTAAHSAPDLSGDAIGQKLGNILKNDTILRTVRLKDNTITEYGFNRLWCVCVCVRCPL